MDDFLVFGKPQILEEEIEEVVACLRSGWLGTGPRVARFEQEFAAFKRSPHVCALGSCSAALHLSLMVAGIEPGDEVITSSLTFCGAVNSIIHAGGRPVLVDVEPATMNLDPREVAARITPRTRAIVPVHFAGRPCNMNALAELAGAHDLRVVEDCAHALEAEYRGMPVGTLGDFGCFSFYATKSVTTGEGGMLIARRQHEAEEVRRLSLHGLSRDAWRRFQDRGYEHYAATGIGFKYNLTDLQAAIGLPQLRRIQSTWERRRGIWLRYDEALRHLPLVLPSPPEADTRHGHHLYTVLIDERQTGLTRDQFFKAMGDAGIGLGVHYLSVPEHPIYRARFGWSPQDYPNAMRIGRETVSLPLSANLSDHDVERVIEAVRRTLGRRAR